MEGRGITCRADAVADGAVVDIFEFTVSGQFSDGIEKDVQHYVGHATPTVYTVKNESEFTLNAEPQGSGWTRLLALQKAKALREDGARDVILNITLTFDYGNGDVARVQMPNAQVHGASIDIPEGTNRQKFAASFTSGDHNFI